jgi:DNA-binding MarR family transcriptional regulator
MTLRLVPPIHRATHRIGLYLANLRDDALSQGEGHILALLATSAPATIAELHRGLAHKRSTLTSILDRLTARGLVTRGVGAKDRRTFVITPTAKGRQVARRVHRHLTDLEEAVGRQVTAADLKGFMRVVSAVEAERRPEVGARAFPTAGGRDAASRRCARRRASMRSRSQRAGERRRAANDAVGESRATPSDETRRCRSDSRSDEAGHLKNSATGRDRS